MQPIGSNKADKVQIEQPIPTRPKSGGRNLSPHLQKILDDELNIDEPKKFTSVRFVPILCSNGKWKLAPQIIDKK